MGSQSHWENIWTTKQTTEVSWFSSDGLTFSLRMIDKWLPADGESKHVLDSGAGASFLADKLLERDGWEVAITDASQGVLETVRQRLPDEFRKRLNTISTDIGAPLDQLPDEWADIWHDRLAFHFLTDDKARIEYAKNVARITRTNGVVIIIAFAMNGPEKCSGLNVVRCDGASIARELSASGREFQLLHEENVQHTTPGGSVQNHVCAILR